MNETTSQRQPKSMCGRIRAAIAQHHSPPDTDAVAACVGLARHEASRLLARMRRMGYVRQVSKATVGRYARPATWALVQEAKPRRKSRPCPECGQPVLPDGQTRPHPDWFRHASGCSRDDWQNPNQIGGGQ